MTANLTRAAQLRRYADLLDVDTETGVGPMPAELRAIAAELDSATRPEPVVKVKLSTLKAIQARGENESEVAALIELDQLIETLEASHGTE